MAFAKWISFSQPVANAPDDPEPKPASVPCTPDGKRFGLVNFGNTCYANSVLQALYFCAPFRDLVIQHSVPYPTINRQDASPLSRHSAPRTLFAALRTLYAQISQNTADKGSIAPRPFIEKLRELNEGFRNTMHHDAHEFLNYLLNRIVEEMEEEKRLRLASGDDLATSSSSSVSHPPAMTASASTSSTHSPGATFVHQIFEGVLTSETRCLTCENVSSRDESFLDLSIDIEQNSSVTACLKQFSASEMLCQKDKFFCDACCDLQEAERRMKIKRLPNVLALHLKRFKYQDGQKHIKLTYRVAFPLELRLFNTVDDIPNPDRLYELFAIVVHIGNGPNHGHYVSIIKTMGTWLIFDDETVDSIRESDIPKYFGDSNAGSAYVLYYQATDIDLSALGLRSPTPDPVPVSQPESSQPEPPQPADSPVSTSRSIPLPPGLSNDPPVPEPAPRPITPPTLKGPLESSLKSPRKAASQILKIHPRPPTTGHALSRAETTLRPRRSAVDEKFSPQPSSRSVPIIPKEDLKPLQDPTSPISGKEKDSDKGMLGWLRPIFKTVRSRPNSEINPDSRPPSQNPHTVLGSPVRHQSTRSSSYSSKDPIDSPISSYRSRISPLPNGKPLLHTRTTDSSAESRQSSVSMNSNSIPTSPTPERNSQSRSLPSIPASPHASVAETPLPASARTSVDHTRSLRRPARPSFKELSPRHLKPPPRPATSTGSPTHTHSPHSAHPSTSSSPAPSSRTSVNRSDPGEDARPKSAHNAYGFVMLPPTTATPPPVPVSAAGTTGRRMGRKLSLSTPILGFRRREKDQ